MQLPRKIDSLTILGLGASIYDWVNITHQDFADQDEVWTINAGARLFRHDVLWDMHTPEWLASLDDKTRDRTQRRRDWLKNHDKPIVMPKAMPDYPTSITYPLRQVIERTNSCYFATGIAYMLAMAMCCEVKRLRLFGCDFSYARDTNTHDEQGRACAEYWIGRLVERGCHVGSSANSHLMDGFKRSRGLIYGYHEPVTFDFPTEGTEVKGKFVGPDYVDQ